MMWKRRNAFGMLLAGLALAACSRENSRPASAARSGAVERVSEKGPIKLIVRAERGEMVVGEKLLLTIDVIAEPNVGVQMPELGQALGPFEVTDQHTPPDIPDSGKRRWTHRCMIRTLEAGEQEVPAIMVKFTDLRDLNASSGDSPIESEISSPLFTLHVKTLLAGEFDPNQFRDIKEAVDVPLPWRAHMWKYGLAAGALAIVALLIWKLMRWRRTKVAAPAPLPPHIWAMRELDVLAADNLLERGEFHAFFFRLSAIARQYIERRFAIMAAEQTTEEFLQQARRSDILHQDHRELLAVFLRLADMVKFAKFQPPRFEAESALNTVRDFVRQTTPPAHEMAGAHGAVPIPAEAAA